MSYVVPDDFCERDNLVGGNVAVAVVFDLIVCGWEGHDVVVLESATPVAIAVVSEGSLRGKIAPC